MRTETSYRSCRIPKLRWAFALIVLVVFATPVTYGQLGTSHRWEHDPDLGVSWDAVEPPLTATIDLEGLASANLVEQIQAAREVVVQARGEIVNHDEVYQACFELLQTQMQSSAENRPARLAFLSAAVETAHNAKQVNALWMLVQENELLTPLVEPKLIELGSSVALDRWRERLKQGPDSSVMELYAIEGIGKLGEASDGEVLEDRLQSPHTNLPIQLASAKALGALVAQGLEPLAEQLLASSSKQGGLFAAHLLGRHTSANAGQLLVRIAEGENPAAQFVAFQHLTHNFPSQALKMGRPLLTAKNPNTRRAAIALFEANEDFSVARLQSFALPDENLSVRMQVTENLVQRLKTAPEKTGPIVDEVIQYYLGGEAWQGIEQAITLAAARQDSSYVPQLISLLDHPEAAVQIRAAWALQELELLPDQMNVLLERTTTTTEKLLQDQFVGRSEQLQTAYIFEAFGKQRFEAARETLLEYVPKNPVMPLTIRVSAVYALGHLAEGTGAESRQLAEDLAERMLDTRVTDPEDVVVCYVSAIAIGRIGDAALVTQLERVDETVVQDAARWSIDQLSR